MRRGITTFVSLLLLSLVAAVTTAQARPDSIPVRGAFSIGDLASFDDLSQYIRGTNVWCAWKSSHVMVHVTLRNTSVERIKATVKPRYYIARGGEHGSGFLGAKDFTLASGQSRSVLIDAGKPEGTPTGARIGRCAPYLYLVDNG
jgi:hypothetical protein